MLYHFQNGVYNLICYIIICCVTLNKLVTKILRNIYNFVFLRLFIIAMDGAETVSKSTQINVITHAEPRPVRGVSFHVPQVTIKIVKQSSLFSRSPFLRRKPIRHRSMKNDQNGLHRCNGFSTDRKSSKIC